MSDERPNATFNIGRQEGNISNVAGDMTIHGGQQYISASADMARTELGKIRAALSNVDFDPILQGWIGELLADAEAEIQQGRPDAQKVARPIERLTRLIKDAGAMSVAGAALIDPLQRIATWLGASGQTIRNLIG